MMKLKLAVLLLVISCAGTIYGRSGPSEYRLNFRVGDIHRVVIKEVLRMEMHFPQVDTDQVKPSVRTTTYSFTETVQKVLPDGAAIIAATLDSFRTVITIGEGKGAEDFFHFNSASDGDIEHNLHDIKVLPRAQFMGQTLVFTMRTDGTIHDFQNLDSFHDDAIGKGYDYDMVHAMLSLSDSLRMGQLLEFGFGGLAAIEKPYTSPSTATEIHVTRTVTAKPSGKNSLTVKEAYFDPPKKIDYLEGIATPMGIKNFYGAGEGSIEMAANFLRHSVYRDTANVYLAVDIDNIPEEITRLVTTDVYPIQVLHGGTVSIKELETHKGIYQDPSEKLMKNAMVIDPETGKVRAVDSTGH
jgi:hypothetical protein